MSLLTILQKFFPIGNSSFNSPSWRYASGLNPSNGKKEYTTDQLMALTGIHRCATLFSDSIAGSKWTINQEIATGGRRNISGTDAGNALRAWSFVDKEAWIFSSVLLGNGFAVLHRNDRGGVSNIETVMSWRVSLERHGKKVHYRIAADSNMNQDERLIPAENVLHLLFRNTGRHTLLGESPLVRLQSSISPILRVQEAQEAVYRNISSPSTYLSSPKPMPIDAAKRLQAAFRENMSGDNLGKGALILDNEIQLHQINIGDLLQQESVALASHGIREIGRAFGIPPSLLGESQQVNNSSSQSELKAFATITLRPFSQRVSDCISEKLFDSNQINSGISVGIDLTNLLLQSGAETAEYYSKLVNGGILTPNMALNALGFEDVDGGNIIRAPVNTIPISFWSSDYRPGQAPTAEPEPEPEKQLSSAKQKINSIVKASS